jgi:hypothetical protein
MGAGDSPPPPSTARAPAAGLFLAQFVGNCQTPRGESVPLLESLQPWGWGSFAYASPLATRAYLHGNFHWLQFPGQPQLLWGRWQGG